jgi:hypothetical protein
MADRSEKHLHGTTHHAEALYQISNHSVKSLTKIVWTDGRMYRRTLVKLNAPDCLLLKFSLNKIFIDPKSLN